MAAVLARYFLIAQLTLKQTILPVCLRALILSSCLLCCVYDQVIYSLAHHNHPLPFLSAEYRRNRIRVAEIFSLVDRTKKELDSKEQEGQQIIKEIQAAQQGPRSLFSHSTGFLPSR